LKKKAFTGLVFLPQKMTFCEKPFFQCLSQKSGFAKIL